MNDTAAILIETKSDAGTLKPMGLGISLLLFGMPAAALVLSIYRLWPALMDAGMSRAGAYVLSLKSGQRGSDDRGDSGLPAGRQSFELGGLLYADASEPNDLAACGDGHCWPPWSLAGWRC